MKSKLGIIAFMLFVFVWPSISFAKMETWDIDKAHSNIYFDIRHTFATVRGLFNDFSGTILLDTENNDNSQVAFEVDVKSINTNIPKRDTHLLSDDFFAADTYPMMTFKSTRVRHVSDNQYILNGNLTIKGVTKEIAVPFTYLGMRENPLMKETIVAGFEAEFTINRLDYHVGDGKFYEMGVIGKDVRILITIEAIKNK